MLIIERKGNIIKDETIYNEGQFIRIKLIEYNGKIYWIKKIKLWHCLWRRQSYHLIRSYGQRIIDRIRLCLYVFLWGFIICLNLLNHQAKSPLI